MNRPSGLFQESKIFYPGKHNRYSVKREVAVIPNGRCAFSSPIVKGLIHEILVCRLMENKYKKFLKKSPAECGIEEFGGAHSEWSIMADLRNVGLDQKFRVVIPKNETLISEGERVTQNT
ncbi:hypothetical protein AYI68_g6706 [Smittium mucronatum]|uniref:Uncharacterized protein n=1 Tax=Smittium mucronatum TaxID=133383 RepID=A0A1R0GQR1_9FUNG|nr:hypothetical protein AYI68_g6706 [Smittium mucronatum]